MEKSENVDEITNLLQNFMDKMEGIYNDTLSIGKTCLIAGKSTNNW